MLESRFRCLLTYKRHHQAKYQRLNANTLYVAAIFFSRSTLHREALPCLPNSCPGFYHLTVLVNYGWTDNNLQLEIHISTAVHVLCQNFETQKYSFHQNCVIFSYPRVPMKFVHNKISWNTVHTFEHTCTLQSATGKFVSR